MTSAADRVMAQKWFYAYELPDGRRAPTYHQGSLDGIHNTRWDMLEKALGGRMGSDSNVIDLACHQGWFSIQMAQAGCNNVVAVDARDGHVADTRLASQAMGVNNIKVIGSDIFKLDSASLGQFDIVLMLGLLYHLENPVGAMRIARELCKGVCVIETQVVPGLSGYVDYGSYEFVRPLKGSYGIIDETDDTHGPEASVTGICFVPSLEALIWCLIKVGFDRVELLDPPDDAYEQLRYHKRVMVVAHSA